MNKKKHKILLGSYIDGINAQDINCYNIAIRLDNNKYEIHSFTHNKLVINNIICHRISNNRIFQKVQKLIMMVAINADVYYLPRVEWIDFIFAKFFKGKRKIVSSIEVEEYLHDKKIEDFFTKRIDSFFAINKELQKAVKNIWNIECPVIYLGFARKNIMLKSKKSLKNIAYAGGLVRRKRPDLILEIAQSFPSIHFDIIGGGPLYDIINEECKKKKLKNIKLWGRVTNDEVYTILNNNDLLLIVSENEGQPKVSLEAASVGVPTCYIKNVYKIDYIKDGINGFEARDVLQMKEIITSILTNPVILSTASRNIYNTSKKYDWDILIDQYEKYFDKILGDNVM